MAASVAEAGSLLRLTIALTSLALLPCCAVRTPEGDPPPHDVDGAGQSPGTMDAARNADAAADASKPADAKKPTDIRKMDSARPPDAPIVYTVSEACKSSGFIICEDFEGEGGVDPKKWALTQYGVTATVDTTRAGAGTKHALHVKGNGQPLNGGSNYMSLISKATFPAAGAHVFLRPFIYPVTPYPHHHVAVMMLRDPLLPDAPYGPYTLQLYPPENAGPILSLWGASGEFSPGSSPIPFDRWSC